MRNVSIKGEDIKLISGKCYYVIDALYLNKVKSEIAGRDIHLLDSELEEVFPYAETPFAKITGRGSFQVRNIKKVKNGDMSPIDKSGFSSDTGLIIFVAEETLYSLLEDYDYDNLVETTTEENINFKYWDDLVSKFGLTNLGLVVAPGIDAGYEFEGSGVYKIEM